MKKERFIINLILSLSVLEGLILSAVFLRRRIPESNLFLISGMTVKNFSLLSTAILLTFFCFIMLLLINRKDQRLTKIVDFIKDDRWFMVILIICLLALFNNIQNVIFPLGSFLRKSFQYSNYFAFTESLRPLYIFGVLFALQILVGLVLIKRPSFKEIIKTNQFTHWLIIFLVLFLVWLVIGFSDYGFLPGYTPENISKVGKFLPLVKPLPGFQVIISIGLAILIIKILSRTVENIQRLPRRIIVVAVIAILVWLIAVVAWKTVPIEPNFMIDIPPYQSGTIYPSSDAFYFDKEANRFLLGKDFEPGSTHVFYSFFISILHFIVGQDYLKTITLQICVLAIGPVFIYLIAERLHTNFSGVLAAVLYILRERNGLLLGKELAGPLVNEYLSENLGLVLLLGFVYILIVWLEKPEERKFFPLIAGAVFGIALLVRSEFLAILLAIVFGVLILYAKQKRYILRGSLFLVLMTGLIIVPWMGRTYLQGGYFSLDKGDFISQRLSSYLEIVKSGNGDQVAINTGDLHEDRKYNRMNALVNHIGNSFQQSFLFLPNNHLPSYFFEKIADSEMLGNSSSKLLNNGETYLQIYTISVPYYWYDWDGNVKPISILPIGFSLAMIALGLLSGWKKTPSTLILLGFLFFSHILIWSFASYSGSRMVKAIEWIPLILYSIGLADLFVSLSNRSGLGNILMTAPLPSQAFPENGRDNLLGRSPAIQLGIFGILLLLGLSPSFLGPLIPEKYTQSDLNHLVNLPDLENTLPEITECYDALPPGQDSSIIYGKAFYPRYFTEDEVYPDKRIGTIPEPYGSRVDFYLIGSDITWVSLPATGPEMVFPNLSEVLVYGTRIQNSYDIADNGTYFRADCVYIKHIPSPNSEPFSILCQGENCR